MYEDRTYAVVDLTTWNEGLTSSEMDLNYFYTKILETSPETLRYSVCGDQFVIKTDNHTDTVILTSFAEAYNVEYTLYSYSDILQVMSTAVWTLTGLI